MESMKCSFCKRRLKLERIYCVTKDGEITMCRDCQSDPKATLRREINEFIADMGGDLGLSQQ